MLKNQTWTGDQWVGAFVIYREPVPRLIITMADDENIPN